MDRVLILTGDAGEELEVYYPERYAGVLIPGGRAPEVIRNDPDVQRIVAHFFDHDLPVGHMVSARGWEDLAQLFRAFHGLLERSAVSA